MNRLISLNKSIGKRQDTGQEIVHRKGNINGSENIQKEHNLVHKKNAN